MKVQGQVVKILPKPKMLGKQRYLHLSTTAMAGALFGALTGVSLIPDAAVAAPLYSQDGINISLDTTVEYSGALRVNDPSATILNEPLFNDGDQNLKHGVVSNQFEVVPVFNMTDGNYGLHISGEAYLDTAYLQGNQNSSAATLNSFPSSSRSFASGTRNIDGQNAELLDAFAYGSHSFAADGTQSVTLKVGRQTLLWGQSLFFTNNSIAGGQAPIDINKALTLANPQAQQVFLPVGQVVLTYQPNNTVTLQGYYQFEWRSDQYPGAGSYFSPADFIGPGAATIITGLSQPAPGLAFPVYFARANDLTPPSQNGQFGMSAQFQLGNYDLGFYALRFDSKAPQFYLSPAAPPYGPSPYNGTLGIPVGVYRLAYPKDIQVYGASLSTTVGPVNVAGEISGRRNQPLFSQPVILGPTNNTNSNPAYAVGDTVNAQASAIYVSGALPLMPGGATLLGEVEANRVLEVTANESALFSGRTRDGVGLQVQFTPIYYKVLKDTDVTIPLGITWYPTGRSEWDQTEQAGTGILNIGVAATYRNVWNVGVDYKDYLGSTSVISSQSSKQAFADRGYVALYLSRTF